MVSCCLAAFETKEGRSTGEAMVVRMPGPIKVLGV